MTFRLLLSILLLTSVALSAPAQTASVATFNIRYPNPGDGPDYWPHRIAAVTEFIGQHDIIGLQEAKFSQLKDLDSGLKQYDRYSVGRDNGGESGETTSIYFRSERFNRKAAGTIWLSPNPEKVGSRGWDAALPRIMSWVLLEDKQAKHDWLIANTHFDHRGQNARLQSGKLIREYLGKKHAELGGNVPVVLLGDFNCMIDSPPYTNIVSTSPEFTFKDARDVTAATPAGPSGTWNGFKQIASGKVIDHVFVAGPARIAEHITHDPKTKAGRFASDHLPVSITAGLAQTQTP